jgi:hypothetical protein
MKKLMMFAAAVTIVGSAFAIDVFDYKATVKNPDLKSVKVKIEGVLTPVTVKYVKSTTLFGYLVNECANCTEGDGHGYLVLANKADKTKGVSILPADLLAEIWPSNGDVKSTKWTAQGYLFAGCGKDTHPWATYSPEQFSNCDYGWSTYKLFGAYNRESNNDQTAIFHDAWLDAAGFGTAVLAGTSGDLCEEGTYCMLLDTLSGSVIGGMYLCANSYGVSVLCLPWGLTTEVVSGTWSIKRTMKVPSIIPEQGYKNTLNNATVDGFINGAIKKINVNATFDSVVPSVTDAPDFPRLSI